MEAAVMISALFSVYFLWMFNRFRMAKDTLEGRMKLVKVCTFALIVLAITTACNCIGTYAYFNRTEEALAEVEMSTVKLMVLVWLRHTAFGHAMGVYY